MRDYVLRRIALMVPSLLGVSIVVFLLTHMLPGDAVMAMLAEAPSFRQQDVDRLRQELGLDRPLLDQYLTYINGVVRGDLGKSLWTGRPVLQEIARRLPVSFELAVIATLTSIFFAITFGILSAIRQDTWVDYAIRVLSIGGLSVPNFVIGTLLLVLPVVWFGYMAPIRYVPFTENPFINLQQFAPPAIALGLRLSASVMRMGRSSLLEVLRQDYIRTALSKGLRERVVVLRHALRNSLIPVVTLFGGQFSFLLGGTVVVETIFNLPGIGRLMLDAISNRDYTMLQGTVLFIAIVFLMMNLIVDLSYAYIDPRIRY